MNKKDKIKYKMITSEWVTYEELDRRLKSNLPFLDEQKIKTFLIKPFFFKLDREGLIKQSKYYFER